MDFLKNVKYFAQGSLRIEYYSNIIYTDPFRIDKDYSDADIIIITHPHFDHFSPEDINKVVKEDTMFIAPSSISDVMKDYEKEYQTDYIEAGDSVDTGYMLFSAVPAYNVIKKDNHPKESGWIGCVFEFEEATLYYTSDTELIDEMHDIEADIIFLPLGQTYTFESVEDAVQAVLRTNASVAVPVHYGLYEGSEADADKFEELLKGQAEVVRL